MALTDEQRKRLTEYVEMGDRGQEPVFVGREDLFNLVRRNVNAALAGNVKGRTVVLSGPPGIGKTAFLTELKRRGRVSDDFVCVEVSNADMHDPRDVVDAIRQASDEPASAGKAWRWLKRESPEIGVAAVRDRNEHLPWKEMGAWADSPVAILLLVDEAHMLKPTPGDTTNLLLHDLHAGGMNPGVPVFAVLTGHVQTPDVLNNTISAGRYAGSNEQPMKPLSSSDSRKYATRMLHWVRTGETHLPGSVRQPDRRIAGWIDKECGGWPHHLRNAMASIAEEHLRADSVELANLDGKRVEENLTRRRLIYYQGRLQSPAFDEMEDVIGNVLSDLHAAPLNRSGLLACARKHIREAGEGLWWRHGRPEAAAREFVLGDGGLIEKGLVGRTMSGNDVRFVCPIASMRRYVQTGEHEVGSRFPDIRGDHFR